MSVRIATPSLVGLLSDLLATAGDDPDTPSLNGLLMHTCRGYWGGEPGLVDLLAGVSTNRFVAGHTYVWCSGQLGDGPMWWDRYDVTALLAVLRPLSKKPDHAVELRLTDDVDDDGVRHRFVVVEEDKDLFGDGVTFSFPARDGDDFPGEGVYRLIADRPSGEWKSPEGEYVPAARRSDLSAVHLSPFLSVGKRRKERLQVYRAHQNQGHHVQIGDAYRGVLMPARYDHEVEDGDTPTAELWAPAFPVAPGSSVASALEDAGVLVPNVDDTATRGQADGEDAGGS